jgi:hypothetical protein
MSEWTTIDFRPAPAAIVEGDRADEPVRRPYDKLLRWQCLYLTGMHNTPYLSEPVAGWLTQRKGQEIRVIAAVCIADGTVHPWNEVFISNKVHTSRHPWCVIQPLPEKQWPSKDSARKRWQEIQGCIIIESSQEE